MIKHCFFCTLSVLIFSLLSPPLLDAQNSFPCSNWENSLLGNALGSAAHDDCGGTTFDLSAMAYQGLGSTTDNQVATYQQLCGDGEVVIHHTAMTDGLAGIELRASLDADAEKVAVAGKLSTQTEMLIRSGSGLAEGRSIKTSFNRHWYKIVRTGNSFTLHHSSNGTSWFIMKSTTVVMPDCIYFGTFARSNSSVTTAAATLENLTITGFTDPVITPTEINFASTGITVAPGGSAEICVNISEACYCSPTEVKVRRKNSTPAEPHLTDFVAPWTILTFEDGSTQECFTLDIGDDPSDNSYQLILKTPSGGNAAVIGGDNILDLNVDADHEEPFCGVWKKQPLPAFLSAAAVDRFGNEFSEFEIKLPNEVGGASGGTSCDCESLGFSTSFFNVVFEDCEDGGTGIGFDAVAGADADGSLKKAVCRGFQHIASLITPNENQCDPNTLAIVNVEIKSSQYVELSGANALASGYITPLLYTGGMASSYPWKVITGGTDDFPELSGNYHGYLAFRTELGNGFAGWYADENVPIPASSALLDLYTATLHEALHFLGVGSFLTHDGAPVPEIGGYSHYDAFLQLDDGTSVIANQPSTFDWALNINPDDLHHSCLDSEGDFGPDMIFKSFAAGGVEIPIFTGTASQPQSRAFSHFEESCDGINEGYLMRKSPLQPGEEIDIHLDELKVLCALGYRVSSVPNCDCTVVGVDDYGPACTDDMFVLEICPEDFNLLYFNIEDLIGNDHGVVNIPIFEPLSANDGTIELDPGPDWDYRFTPQGFGTHVLRYRPATTQFCYHPVNDTYVFIEVIPGDCPCEFSDGSEMNCGYNNNPVNLVCNPECCAILPDDIPPNLNGLQLGFPEIPYELPGWGIASGTPDYDFGEYLYPESGYVAGGLALGYDGSLEDGESFYTPVAVNQGVYFIGFHSLAYNVADGGAPGTKVYLVSEEIKNQYFSGSPFDDVESPLIEAAIAGQSGQFEIGQYNFPLEALPPVGPNDPGIVRFGACFEINESYDNLWFTPQVGSPYSPEGIQQLMDAEATRLVYFTGVDQVELIPDNFSAGLDDSILCGESITLGGQHFNMLSEVEVLYTWYEEDQQGNLTEVASYTVEIDIFGQVLVNGMPVVDILTDIPTVDVNPMETTSYHLERSVVNSDEILDFEFCQISDELLITVEGDCEPLLTCPCEGQNAININAGTGTLWDDTDLATLVAPSIFGQNTIDLSNSCVAISGTLLIEPDGVNTQPDLVFLNGALRMQPESEIIVQSNAELLLFGVNDTDTDGSGLHACEFMWQGVTVESGATLNMIVTTIEDARAAVTVHDEATLSFNSNTFNDNLIGILVPKNNGVLQNITIPPTGIIGNTFDNPNGLIGTFDEEIAIGAQAEAGILLNDVSWFTVGSNAGTAQNDFTNLENGIVTVHSAMGVFKSTFQGITSNGILATRNSFVIAQDNTFDVMLNGIFAESSSLSAHDNTITNVEEGIHANLGLLGVLEVKSHDITANRNCIAVEQSIFAHHINISQTNELTLRLDPTGNYAADRAAIRFSDVIEGGLLNDATISNNIITINGVGQGIVMENAGDVDIQYNVIEYQNPADPAIVLGGIYHGISLLNADQNYLYGNEISVADNSDPFPELIGMNINSSMGTLLCCNSTEDGDRGVFFSGNCNDTRLRNTIMTNQRLGLQIGEGTVIGLQEHAGNQWEVPFGEFAAQHLETNPGIISASAFMVQSPQATAFWPAPNLLSTVNSPGSESTWFQEFPGSAEPCQNDGVCLPVPDPQPIQGGEVTDLDIVTANSEWLQYNYGDMLQWEGGKDLYGRLIFSPVLIGIETDLSSFYQTESSTATGNYVAVNNQLKALAAIQPLGSTTVMSDLAVAQGLLEDMTQLELDYSNAVSDTEKAILEGLYQQKAGELRVALGTIGTQQEEASIQLPVEATNIIGANNTLSAPHILAENQKGVDAIYLTLLSNATTVLDQSQISFLLPIANQCPLTGGNAVYRARALLKMNGDYVFDDDNCTELQTLRSNQDGQNETFSIAERTNTEPNLADKEWRIYPNPTDGQFHIVSKSLDQLRRVVLYDLHGQLAEQWSNNGERSEYILKSNLPDGIYLVQLEMLDGSTINRKLIILN